MPGSRPPRRVFVDELSGAKAGSVIELDARESRHLLAVRRAIVGAFVEAFDASGLCAAAAVEVSPEGKALLRLTSEPVRAKRPESADLVVFSALPKGGRADWMVEKLCELGAGILVPIITERSIVDPGKGRLQRFERIAREAAKQSRRAGTLRISPPFALEVAIDQFVRSGEGGAVLVTEIDGRPLSEISARQVFIGPEGGWTAQEIEMMSVVGLQPARLTGTVLRTETAAVAAVAILLLGHDSNS